MRTHSAYGLRMARPIPELIDALGGLTALAKELGHTNPTTVQGWKDRGAIPLKQIPRVIEAGRRKGIALTADDFLPAAAPSDAKAA